MPMFCLENARLALPEELLPGSLMVENGRIAHIFPHQLQVPALEGVQRINAHGSVVLPGGLDPHTHFNLTVGSTHVADGFAKASEAALRGGTTCIVEHPGFGPRGCDLFHQVHIYQQQAHGHMAVDYGFHLVFQQDGDQNAPQWPVLAQIPTAVQAGFCSGKAYMTYDGKLDDDHLLELMLAMAKARCLLTVHAENDAIPRFLQKTLPANQPLSHARSRPAHCEAEAVHRLLSLAKTANVPVYIVHVSTAAALEHIAAAKQAGQQVFAETCPQYLFLNESAYEQPQGRDYIMAPPLRSPADQQALWQALASGLIDVVATDHCAFSHMQKAAAPTVFQCPGGVPGVGSRLPLLYTHGVLAGRISLPRFLDLVAAAPARIFGLPHKGTLKVGADADLVLLPPQEQPSEQPCTPQQGMDYSPYEKLSVQGWPVQVYLRGHKVLDNEQVLLPYQGIFQKREIGGSVCPSYVPASLPFQLGLCKE